MLSKWCLVFAALNGGLAVILGAFGAHALKTKLSASLLATWQVGVQYHFYHVFALLCVGMLLKQGIGKANMLSWSAAFFGGGILLFSGSLYLLALGGPRWLGPLTPLGGLSFILGWLTLAVANYR